jgi:hypothetical protein
VVSRFEEQNRNFGHGISQEMQHDHVFRLEAARQAQWRARATFHDLRDEVRRVMSVHRFKI